jgi:hypothetical protein
MQTSPDTTTTTKTPEANDSSTGCCPRFDPAPYEDRELVWQDKRFLKESVHCVLHIPLDMQRVVKRAHERIAAADAAVEPPLFLGEDVSPWRSDLYLEVAKDIPSAEMVRLSGTYFTKVFDGPFRDAPKWMEAMEDDLAARGQHAKHMYLGYTTCPKCSKAYGHNYVVVYAQVA